MAVDTPNVAANGAPSATIPKVFPMAKGDEEESYSKNSQFQAFLNKVPMSALDAELEKVALPSGTGPVRVADLGTSSGPNTIGTVSHIVEKLKYRVPKDAEFQAYFNDVPSNDFNNLFQLLCSDSRAKNFFAAGAPGSYLERRFPQSSIHVFHSAVALHWMSKIPDEILDKESPAYNNGQPWYQHSQSAVAKAYQEQTLLELTSFFQARAAELAPGGLMFLLFSGTETSYPYEIDHGDLVYNFQRDMIEILTDLIAEGLVSEEQLDTFNIPVYHRTREDLTNALEACGSTLKVEVMKLHKVDFSEAFAGMDACSISKKLKAMFKAAMSTLVEGHFGTSLADVIWQRYYKLIQKKSGTRPEILTVWIVGLIRN
ncbi:unnamed protein product [Calypogeia fissa]